MAFDQSGEHVTCDTFISFRLSGLPLVSVLLDKLRLFGRILECSALRRERTLPNACHPWTI